MTSSVGFAAERFLTEVLGAKNIRIKGDEITHACLFISHSNDHKEPGASLNAEKLLYNCWKCGSGGTLLWLTENVLEIGGAKARALIKEYFDSEEVHEETFLQGIEKLWAEQSAETMSRFSMKMIEGWRCPTHYMDSRGITREVQEEMLTGLNKTNIDEVEVGKETVQIVQPRIVMPHVFHHVLRGWTQRLVDKRQKGTKYKHTGQFPKKTTLYNFDGARKFDSVIVVESPMSVLKLKSEGIHNVVGTFGAEVNKGQEDLMARFDEVILFPDGDAAGYRALSQMDRRGNIFGLRYTLVSRTNMWIVDHGRNEEGEFNETDPADYSADELRALIDRKVSADTWDYVWRDERVDKKANRSKVRVGPEDEGQWD